MGIRVRGRWFEPPATTTQQGAALAALVMAAGQSYAPGAPSATVQNGSGALVVTVASGQSYSGPLTPATVTTLIVTDASGGSQSNIPITFGQYFATGDVPAGATVIGKIGGVPITTQTAIKATHANGSARHATITCLIPSLSALGSQTITLETAAPVSGGTAISKADILATAFDAAVSCDIGGTVYSVSARSLLDGSVPAVLDPLTPWLSGTQVSEFVIGGRLRNGGVTHAHLCAYFHVRAYGVAGNVTRVRCDVLLENGWAFTAGAGAITGNMVATVGGVTVYSNAAYTLYHHSRWFARGWWGADPQVRVNHDRAYLKASKAVPNYGPGGVSEGILNAYLSYSPGSNVNLRTAWNDTGYHMQIGPMPEWDAAYIKTGDIRAFNATIANALAGMSYSYHYRDENTGYPPKIDTYPTLTELGSGGPLVRGTGGNIYDHQPASDSASHQPLLGYLAYLLTGDYVHLEELHFLAAYNLFVADIGYRQYDTNDPTWGFPGIQLRGRAWGVNTVAHAAAIAPDGHTMKAYFAQKVNNSIASWIATGVTPGGADYNTLGAPYDQDWTGGANKYNVWQADFLAICAGRWVDFEFTNATSLAQWLAKMPAGRMGQPGIGNGYCKYWASEYNFTRGLGQTALGVNNYFATWGQVYADQWGFACTPPGPSLTPGFAIDGMTPTDGTGYYANLSGALSMAVDVGVATAETWRSYQQMGAIDYSARPLWDIQPRFTVPAAIAALAVNQWHEFPNSNASAVTPCPGNNCSYSGNTGYQSVMWAWSGGAYDIKRDRLMLFGGGHFDYAGNEVYAFDLRAGAWSLLTQPYTPVTQDVTFYATTPTLQPAPTHTYGRLQYLHQIDALLCFGVGAYGGNLGISNDTCALDMTTNSWSTKTARPDVSSEQEAGAFSAIDGFGRVWLHTNEGPARLHSYDPSTNAWTTYSSGVQCYFNQGPGVAVDTKRNRLVVVGADNNGAWSRYWNLNSPNTAPVTLSGVPAAMAVDAGIGFVYDPIGDRFLGWNGGTTIHVLNAATLAWSTITATGANPGNPTGIDFGQGTRGTYGRMRYVPSLHGVVLVTEMTRNVFFLKL